MRLVYISTYTLPSEKAFGVQITNMCQSFANNLQVELLIPEGAKEDVFTYYSLSENFKVTRLPRRGSGLSGFVGYWWKTISFLLRCRAYLRKDPADIVYVREPAVGFFFSGHVLEMHTLPNKVTFIHRYLWRRASKIVVLTSFIKKTLQEEGFAEEDIYVAPDAVSEIHLDAKIDKEDARKEISLPVDKKIIGYVGKYKTPFAKGKGVDELIEAFPEIKKQHKDAFLLLVGINPESIEGVKKKIQESGIREDFKVVGHVKQAQIVTHLHAADILVMNYPWSEHHAYQMSSMKLYEYMAAGKPIVASRMPSICEVLNDKNARLIEPDNHDDLVAGIFQVLEDGAYAQNIAEQARQDVRKYSWQNRARGIIEFLQ